MLRFSPLLRRGSLFCSTVCLAEEQRSFEFFQDAKIRDEQFGSWRPWTREWQADWDGRAPGNSSAPKNKTTRHVFLVRHGQYNLNSAENELTALGREQSRLTGQRLRRMAEAAMEDHYGKVEVKWTTVVHSDVKRAAETAGIIYDQLTGEPQSSLSSPLICDPLLAEGWPCVPRPYAKDVRPSQVLADSTRIESAFRKYVRRAVDGKQGEKTDVKSEVQQTGSANASGDSPLETSSQENHEFILLVCHQNVIRYFLCRALQLPPEYWLRFRGDNCGLTEIIIYPDGRISLGKFADVGHLDITQQTFH